MPFFKTCQIRKTDSRTLHPVIIACRYTVLSIGLSVLFILLTTLVLILTQHPERVIRMDSSVQSSNNAPTPQTDTHWDGALSGISIGLIAGGFDPTLCAPAFAILGGIMGYQLDKTH